MKDTLIYFAFRGLVFCCRILPWWTIKQLSKFTTFLLHDCIRIRRKTTSSNIARCFPNKTPQEHRTITRQCFHYYSDCLWETIKLSHVSAEQMQQRVKIKDVDPVTNYLKQNKNVLIWSGHCGNLDSYPICGTYFPTFTAYKKIKNPIFEKWVKKQREKFNAKTIPSHKIINFYKQQNQTQAHAMFLFSDQRPSPSTRNIATIDFFSIPTTFTKGAFILAKRYKTPVIYASIKRIKLGHHEISFREIPSTPDGNTLQEAVKLLEQDIIAAPEAYFWMHKRFKTTQPPAKENAPAHNTPPPETHAADHTTL
jgi:Kdo2-lipid IVA lauroyltransferase/acyltransferase